MTNRYRVFVQIFGRLPTSSVSVEEMPAVDWTQTSDGEEMFSTNEWKYRSERLIFDELCAVYLGSGVSHSRVVLETQRRWQRWGPSSIRGYLAAEPSRLIGPAPTRRRLHVGGGGPLFIHLPSMSALLFVVSWNRPTQAVSLPPGGKVETSGGGWYHPVHTIELRDRSFLAGSKLAVANCMEWRGDL